jgi:thioredoxin-related protein
MIKKYILPLLILIIIATVYANNNPSVNFKEDAAGGIQFYNASWKQALEKAKLENKLIFLDIYATWCGPCKKLKKRTFSNDKVGKYFNEHFINVSLDGEEGDGVSVSNTYHVSSYPSLFFINSEGKIISKSEGYLNAKEIVDFAKTVVK